MPSRPFPILFHASARHFQIRSRANGRPRCAEGRIRPNDPEWGFPSSTVLLCTEGSNKSRAVHFHIRCACTHVHWPVQKDRIFEQIDFHKLFTLNYWQRQWEHKQITALLRSYRLFQAFSYLQCPFLTLALCEWFGANKNNWRQFSSTSTKEKQWQ